MDYEAEIAKLAAKAEPLRKLDDDDERAEALGPIVDQINALRAKQSGDKPLPVAIEPGSGIEEPASIQPRSTLSVTRK
jgi:hypothetical protein